VFGSHLSIAGSMVNALDEARGLGLDTVQVFTKNQQQWRVPPMDAAVAREFRARTSDLGWDGRLVSHASYLINLASCKDDLWQKSVDLMTVEIERCHELGITYLVHHPGSHVGSTLEHGLSRIIEAYATLFARTAGAAVVSCLEGTAGGGSTIGARFEELATLRTEIARTTGRAERVGVCLDTCHLHAAGHDMSTRDAADETLERFDRLVGLGHVRVWHLNDGKGSRGSHLDRHEHIGHGYVGGGLIEPVSEDAQPVLPLPALARGVREAIAARRPAKKPKAATPATPAAFDPVRLASSGFARVLADARFAAVPKILETPKEDSPDGTPWDSINLARLRSLLPSG
jgi:deoxyribonuclease-4